MIETIAVFDIGKTNKKILLFDKNLNVVFENSIRFKEIVDDDDFPCDDIEAIENWIKDQVYSILKQGVFKINAINFTTHGATLMYLDKNGKRFTPLYNYLKPLDDFDFSKFYEKYGGVEEFSRKTASPAYGMLNSGLQIYWLKNAKTNYWKKVDKILHYPQYLSYLFSHKITSDCTSIGSHTAMWDFDRMEYHTWLEEENISLPEPIDGKEFTMVNIKGNEIAIGSGLHDSSASLIPALEKSGGKEFVLLSTGTWIITMNPFSKEQITQFQLKNKCLCYMTTNRQQVKSSMQFLGHLHQVISSEVSSYFGLEDAYYKQLTLNKELCAQTLSHSKKIFFPDGIREDYKTDLTVLHHYSSYENAYYQLLFEISHLVFEAIELILDKKNNMEDIYISGGFNKNQLFVHYLSLLMPDKKIKISDIKNESALGAALLMKDHLD